MIIAFIGVDGSGKTTLSRKLKNKLAQEGYSAVVIEPFHYLIFSPALEIVKKIILLLRGGVTHSTGKSEKRKKSFLGGKNKFFLFKLWPIIALIDHWLYFLIKIRPLEKKYDYIIADRFFFDFASSFNYFGYTTNWLNNLYLRLIPKPDLTFVLDLRPDLARQREKGDRHTLGFFHSQRVYYLSLVKKFGLCKINASVLIQKALDNVLAKIEVN